MRILHIAPALLAAALLAAALPVAAHAATSAAPKASGWTFAPGAAGAAALTIGTPGTDRDAFRLDCSAGKMSLSTWAPGPPRNISEGRFPTDVRVLFGTREFTFTATGEVTGPGRTTRVDALIADPAAFLTSLDRVSRLTTVIFAGRRMAVTPVAAQTADFRKACGF